MRKTITILTLAALLAAGHLSAQQPSTPEKRRGQRTEQRTRRNEDRTRERPGRRQQKDTVPQPDRKGARLRFLEQNHNFGDIARKGGDLTHEFRFRNEGDTPLVITRVVTSCSCLKGSFSKRPVVPRAEGVLRIIYEPHKSEAGVFNKVIFVYSNSADGNELITVQGNSIERVPADRAARNKKKKD